MQARGELVPPISSSFGQFGASLAIISEFLFVGQPGSVYFLV